ncbi:inorganic diphosphatase [Lichenicola cladoniae]|uniref:Inorganic pyrophosphatase n=1 Tax=Lichenicola cladoniae TaxID=1484109 RepID=A0A6M8HS52_9PROT|nr:inorganic diphosphatase [Lichenicola cladoniae]NPD65603.1 inorganic diphosphatase [Acetobacteraceae bacterium]QKE91359.1 inorganic diphosphatase [Lichenicola cladoniae]
MDVSKISPGKDVPWDINVVIEIPQGSQVKYEIDKESGAIFVDRFLFTPMAYPAAYGFIPGTLAADGDPADALVLAPAPMVPGAVIRARPIGMLKMEDESGMDEKIICVPHDKMHTQFTDVHEIGDLPEITRLAIEHFFTRYKDLEKGKWVKVTGWAGKEEAGQIIRESLAAAQKA